MQACKCPSLLCPFSSLAALDDSASLLPDSEEARFFCNTTPVSFTILGPTHQQDLLESYHDAADEASRTAGVRSHPCEPDADGQGHGYLGHDRPRRRWIMVSSKLLRDSYRWTAG